MRSVWRFGNVKVAEKKQFGKEFKKKRKKEEAHTRDQNAWSANDPFHRPPHCPPRRFESQGKAGQVENTCFFLNRLFTWNTRRVLCRLGTFTFGHEYKAHGSPFKNVYIEISPCAVPTASLLVSSFHFLLSVSGNPSKALSHLYTQSLHLHVASNFFLGGGTMILPGSILTCAPQGIGIIRMWDSHSDNPDDSDSHQNNIWVIKVTVSAYTTACFPTGGST